MELGKLKNRSYSPKKAILNKKFDLFISFTNHLWQQRTRIRKMTYEDGGIGYPDYFGYPKAGNLNGDIIDAIQDGFWLLAENKFTTKKQFVKYILSSPAYSFVDSFIKRIE